MNKEKTYVIGHKNPDTDSIVSAIGLAALRKAQGLEGFIAARAGDINRQTAFILDRLKIPAPVYLQNVFPKVNEVMSTEVVSVTEDVPLFNVMGIMRSQKVRFVPVLGPGNKTVGVLTLMDLAKRYVEFGEVRTGSEVRTTLPNLIRTLKAEPILDFLGGDDVTFALYVAAMSTDSFEKNLSLKNTEAGRETLREAVVVGDRRNIQLSAIKRGVGLLIISGGFRVSDDVIEAARASRTSIVVCAFDSATTANLAGLSTPARLVCSKEFGSAAPSDLCEDIKDRLVNTDGLIVADDDGVMQGVITKTNLIKTARTNLVLVDHNELGQAIDGADKVNIREIIDHHRLGSLQTAQPITFLCEPVGATSTLIAELYRRSGISIDKKIAGALLAGVISDTVMLKSPTTTHRDREIVQWLTSESGLAFEGFARDIFNAASSLKKRGAALTVSEDYKVFEAGSRRFGVGQVEVIGFGEFFDEKEALRQELEGIKRKKDLSLSALLVTDIVAGTSLLLACGEKKVIQHLDYPKVDEGVFELKAVLSRKKQVVPHLLAVFERVF